MKDVFNFLKLIKLFVIIVLLSSTSVLCDIDISINESRSNLPNQIISEHFIIHYDLSNTTFNYAESIKDFAEYSYQKECIELG